MNPQFNDFTYTLAAGQEFQLYHQGDTLICLEADAKFKIGIDGSTLTNFQKGLAYHTEGQPFSYVSVQNPNNTEIDITLAVAQGGITDARLVPSTSIQSQALGGDKIVSGAMLMAPLAATEIVADDVTRQSVMITNLGAETLWIGTAGVAVFEGAPVPPGQCLTITTTAAIYGIHQGGAEQQIATLEVQL